MESGCCTAYPRRRQYGRLICRRPSCISAVDRFIVDLGVHLFFEYSHFGDVAFRMVPQFGSSNGIGGLELMARASGVAEPAKKSWLDVSLSVLR